MSSLSGIVEAEAEEQNVSATVRRGPQNEAGHHRIDRLEHTGIDRLVDGEQRQLEGLRRDRQLLTGGPADGQVGGNRKIVLNNSRFSTA